MDEEGCSIPLSSFLLSVRTFYHYLITGFGRSQSGRIDSYLSVGVGS